MTGSESGTGVGDGGLDVESIAGNYFVAAYPPFSAWETAQVPRLREALGAAPGAGSTGIYVHIPFCEKKCDYCYYLSYVGAKPERVDRYLDALTREMELYAAQPALAGRGVGFAYLGGGTPSTLTDTQVARLGRGLRSCLEWDGVREITCECAPRSARSDFLAELRALGVSRLSLGVQSFDDALLRRNGRVHLEKDVLPAYRRIREAGFDCVNLDLMAGLVGETDATWRESVRRAIELEPESVTIYQMEVPHNTKLYGDLVSESISVPPASWESKRKRLDHGFRKLEEAGYTLVSAYAAVRDPERQRFHYQHDLWSGGDMIGLGVASFGYLAGVHYQNEVTLDEYLGAVEAGRLPVKRAFRLRDRDRLVREFLLQLKLGRVDTRRLRDKFGTGIEAIRGPVLADLERRGLLRVLADEVTLTRRGLLAVDELLPELYDPPYRQRRYT